MDTIEKQKKGQTEKIIFRTSIEMKAFVKEFAEKMGLDVSDMMRLILEYYLMAYFVKQGSYAEIRRKFFDLYPEHNPKTSSRKDKGKKKKNG